MNYSAPPPTPPPPPVPGASQYGLSDLEAPPVPNRSNPLCAPPLSHPPIPFLTWTAPGTPLFGAATAYQVSEKREEREVISGVCQDGNPQKPAKRPSEGFAGFWRGDQFGEFQTR